MIGAEVTEDIYMKWIGENIKKTYTLTLYYYILTVLENVTPSHPSSYTVTPFVAVSTPYF